MNDLTQTINELVAIAVATGADDLSALADIHGRLMLLEGTSAKDGGKGSSLRGPAARLKRLAEQIMLREFDDPQGAVRQLADGIAALQGIVDGVVAPVAAESELPKATASSGHGDELDEEQILSPEDCPLAREFVIEARGHIEAAEASVLTLEENAGDAEAINAVFRAFHTIKGVAGFLNLRQIGALAHTAENLLDLARQGQILLQGAALETVLAANDLMKLLVNHVASAAESGKPIPAEGALGALLDRLTACIAGKADTLAPAPKSQPADATKNVEPRPGAGKSAMAAETTVRIATDRLDSLINSVGELVIAQAMVAQDAKSLLSNNHRLARNLGHLGKITRGLQELSMSMRMVPINGVFQKMARLVRDLAKKTGKEIDLAVVGGDTELDRNLIEAITDPLVHMVRNAADHGLETPDDREQLGKPRTGRIELKAYHHSGNIVIEISDDGRGLNRSKLLKKAIAAGILSEGDQPGEQEIFKLVFHAGLSTAEAVTDVSGRGVGMDVVKRNVEALRGRIDIASTQGKGATFAIRLPLTLAVIDGLVVKVGSARFILPILSVEQSLRPKAPQLSTVQNRGEICMVRDDLLPLYRLSRLLDVPTACDDPTGALVVIVRDDQRRCCLMVDELLGQQQVVIKSLGDGVGELRGISGGAILGDGNVSLILDVPGLIDLASGV